MTYAQIVLFALFGLTLAGLIWGKFRYDLVSFAALVASVVLGVVPANQAFSGFSNDATIIVILVLVVTAGLSRSGAVELVTKRLIDSSMSVSRHLTVMGGIATVLSAFMNNVAALALLMPLDIQAAQKANRSAASTLMPLAAATILGGLLTVIGTPANIIVASYRQTMSGQPFAMFDFLPVGLVCVIFGLGFICTIGWRIIPQRAGNNAVAELMATKDYVSELVVSPESKSIGMLVEALYPQAEESDVSVLGLVRKGKRLPGRASKQEIAKGDILVVQGGPDGLNAFAGAADLGLQGKAGEASQLSADFIFAEAVVSRDSRLIGRTANEVQLMRAYGVSLLGLSRAGRVIRDRVRRTALQTGDVLLLLGPSDTMDDVIARLDCLPLARRSAVTRYDKALLAIGLFAAAVAASAFGLLPLTIGLAAVVIAYVLCDIIPMREIYDAIEWPIVVLLGALIPLGTALETSGGTALIANGIAAVTVSLPAWVALTAMLVVTMFLSDILNNAATAVIAAPVAYGLAQALGVNPDAFLMAVAIGASCAFLTPIGHQNNLLIMGPGGYRFGDYWRFGLPLEAIIVAVAIPAILVFWPL
jgi:di/tricarboxylate transporter